MKKITLLAVIFVIAVSCSGKKQVARALNSGNYNEAIYDALKRLQANKEAKRNQEFKVLLKDAYVKANTRDLEAIKNLRAAKNPEFYQRIYETYLALDERQNAVRPILPLVYNGREIKFKFVDYTPSILAAREDVSNFKYETSLDLLETDDKALIREAYHQLAYIERINPNYEDTRELMQEAHERGTVHIAVSIENQTRQVIPRRLEAALLDFNTYGLDQFWMAYHGNPDPKNDYDYAMQLQLAQINISPERLREREFVRERDIKDGWQYKLDANGNVMKDSLGNDIKEDKIIRVRARLFETIQEKSSQIVARVVFSDLKNQEVIESFPIDSGFVFENFFARFRGDKRALSREDLDLIRNRAIPYPTNEQMVFDSGEDLKLKLKRIIQDYRL
ncbi:hypothetical protein [Winogradskyella sp. A3E31]|uniref:hypothetical protein n=1 Tax=Winogradskyella sp. A3E31 TaxID=3349637 RepID=UPI00398A7C50